MHFAWMTECFWVFCLFFFHLFLSLCCLLFRVPFLLPILKTEYAVDKIMAAYHSNQSILMMPRILYLFYVMQS